MTDPLKNKTGFLTLFCIAVATLLLIGTVKAANTDVNVSVWTDQNVNLNTNVNAGGSVDLNIDGVPIDNRITNIVSTSNAGLMSWNNLMYVFDEMSKYFYGTENPHPVAVSLFNSLNSVFVNRADEQVINAKLDNLNMRVLMLERTMEKVNATAYCEGKISVMKEYNLSWVKCGENSTYYYNVDPKNWAGKDIIAIDVSEPAETPKAEVKTVNITMDKFEVSELNAGGNATASVAVKNEGNAAGVAKISLSIPEGWSYQPVYDVTINPGEEKNLSFTIFIPKDSSGDARIIVLAVYDSADGTKIANAEVTKTVLVPIDMQIVNYLTHVFAGNSSNAQVMGMPL
jgi:hypothetical protein